MPAASVDVGTVRQRFNFDWAMDPDNGVEGQDTYWWWARSIRVDPNEIIADDDEGGLWSIPFTTDGEDGVTFGEPVKVRETYVPVSTAGDGATATAVVQRRRQRALATDLSKPAKDPRKPTNPAASVPSEPEEAHMPEITPDQLARLRALPEDADQAQIDAAISGTTPDPVVPEPDPVVEAEVELVPAAASAKTVTVSEDQWKTTNDRLAAAEARLNERDQQDAKTHRDGLIATALRDGRITPAEQKDWRGDLDKWPEATEAALGRLQAGRVPLAERGAASNGPDPDNPMSGEIPSTGWFPQLATTKEG